MGLSILSFLTGDKLCKGVSIILFLMVVGLGGVYIANTLTLEHQIKEREITIKKQGEVITSKESKIKELQASLMQKRVELDVQNKLLEANKAEQAKAIETIKKEKQTIEKRYFAYREWINNFKGEADETSCTHARLFFNSATW